MFDVELAFGALESDALGDSLVAPPDFVPVVFDPVTFGSISFCTVLSTLSLLIGLLKNPVAPTILA